MKILIEESRVNAESVFGGRRTRIAAAGVMVSAVLLTSACAAGRHAQTANQIPTQDGSDVTVRNMALRGLAIYAPSGNPYYAQGSTVRMRMVLVNTGTRTDALTGLTSRSITGGGSYASPTAASSAETPSTSQSSTSASIPTGAQTIVVGAGSRASYGVPDSTRVLLLRGTKSKLYPGNAIKITFTFARAGDVTVSVPVQLSATPGTETVEPAAGASEGG